MKIPPINLPLDAVAHARWLEHRAVAAETELRDLRAWKDAVSRQLNMATSDSTAANGQVETNRNDIKELKGRAGIPPGGNPGDTVTRYDGGLPDWTSVPYAVTPEYWVWLEDGAPDWETNNTGGLPEPVIEDNGKWLHPIEDGTGLLEAPFVLHVSVTPHSDGEAFGVYRPGFESSNYTPPHYTLSIQNDGAFRAVVQLDEFLYYSGTTVRVPEFLELEPGERVLWRVQTGTSGTYECNVTPFPLPDGVGYTDRGFTTSVGSMRLSQQWSALDDLEPAVGGVPFVNGTGESKIIGKITAAVTTAPTGSGVQVDVFLNGVSILSAPLAVAAGQTYAEMVPDASTTSLTVGDYSFPVVVFEPGDRLTVEIVSVGSTTPGNGLTVQAYYG